jgi:hypothetical protein
MRRRSPVAMHCAKEMPLHWLPSLLVPRDITDSVSIPFSLLPDDAPLGAKAISPTAETRYEAMRKHMTTIFDEALSGQTIAGDRVVYLGEDVRHGG